MPISDGVNVKETWQDEPADKEPGQLFVRAKSPSLRPLIVNEESAIGVCDVFVRLSVRVEDEPTAGVEKTRLPAEYWRPELISRFVLKEPGAAIKVG